MNNKLYTVIGAVVLLAVGLVSGYSLAPKSSPSLGGYNPPVQSAGGFTQVLSTSTAYTLACNPTNIEWLGTAALATGTINAATSTFLACPNINNIGASVNGNKIVNDSTNTVAYQGGTGVVFKCETQGVGTSTLGPGGTCTATGFTLLASSTLDMSYLFDGASTTLVVDVGNNYK